MSKKNVTIKADFAIDVVEGTMPREDGDICIASYMNFLIVNRGGNIHCITQHQCR